MIAVFPFCGMMVFVANEGRLLFMKRYEMDLCAGALWKKILLFSVPLMFTNLLQVVFNMSDVAVVGKFAGSLALGSVGSTSILVTMFTGILIGMASGVNALTALYIGAKNDRNVRETVHTACILCLSSGLLILLFGFTFARHILTMMNTKPELIDGAVRYLRIYVFGMPALALFNFGNAVLSASGDTKRPLYYLSFAGVINVILNLFFVIICKLDVAGVALASIIAEYISAALVIALLLRSRENYALHPSELQISPDKVGRILQISIPSAIQNILFAIANIFVQTSVNSFDHVIVEGNSAAANTDPLVYNMMAAIYTGCTSFIAQNRGAGKRERCRRSYELCLLYATCVGLILGISLYLLRVPFLSLFTNDAEVVTAGTTRLAIMALSYGLSPLMDCTLAASRGLGRTVIPTILVILGSVVFRLAWIFTIFAYFHTIQSLYLLYAFSWGITGIPELIYFIYIYRHGAAEPEV